MITIHYAPLGPQAAICGYFAGKGHAISHTYTEATCAACKRRSLDVYRQVSATSPTP